MVPSIWQGEEDQLVMELIRDGASVNLQEGNSGWTPLIYCAVRGLYEEAPYLRHSLIYSALSYIWHSSLHAAHFLINDILY